MRAIFAVAIAAAASCASVGEATAADAAICVGYVQTALREAKEANELACGLDPDDPKWSLDENVHMDWCLHASDDAVKEQWGLDIPGQDTRKRVLLICRHCRSYTDSAMQQEAEETKFHCNFASTSPRWPKTDSDGDIFSKHMKWCMGLKAGEPGYAYNFLDIGSPTLRAAYTYPEQAARDADLKACKANYHPSIGRARPTKEDLTRTNGRVIGLPQGAVNNPCVDSSGRMRRSLKECDPAAAASSSTSSSKVDKGLPKDAVHNPTGKSGVIGAGPLEGDQSTSSRGPSAAGAPGAAATPGGVRSLGGATYGGGR